MPRRPASPFTTIRSEGALLPPEVLSRITEADKKLGGLSPSDYGLVPTERVTEAISRSWNRLIGLWAAFEPSLDSFNPNDPGTGATRDRWLMPLFSELEFRHLPVAKATEIEGASYPISHAWEQVPIHLIGAGLDLDRRTPGVAGAARVSPHSLVQDYLNRSSALWGVVSNGRELRLLRDNASLTRQAFLAFDLQAMFSGEAYSDFALLWLICHQSRFEAQDGRPESCWLERWTEAAKAQGTRALETLRQGVEVAIRELGADFLAHQANEELRAKLRSGDLSTLDYYRQLLRLVYRLMFLFVAEDRDLLHPAGTPEEARATYANYYSTARLRSLAERRRGTKHADLWRGIQVVVGALGEDEGCPELGLTYLGSFLFSTEACPDLDPAQISNTHLLAALRALGFTEQGRTLRQIDYRNMGSEELGSIYESLLELHPEIHAETATFELSTAAGHERKTTGSYYTPTSLISALLDSALDPVLEEAASKGEEAILSLKVLDPACGSGHFLTAAAHRIARRLASVRTDEREPAPGPYRTALRDVIGRCVFGIDVNPMATELCKVSLWMEAVEPGRPLSFLDHHIVCGNSLLGTTPKLLAQGIPDEAFTALEGDDKADVKSLKARNKEERKGQASLFGEAAPPDLVGPVAERVAALEATSDDSPAALHEKQHAWEALEASAEAAHAKLVADAWCAAFVLQKTKDAPVLTLGVLEQLIKDPDGGDPKLHEAIAELAGRYRFLHPHLAFPQVFAVAGQHVEPDNPEQGWSGGFDVVLGNPPWERVKLQEKEWFAERRYDIADAPNAAARKKMIAALEDEDPSLFLAWIRALRQAEGESQLLRKAGRYPLTGQGDINTYAVFAEGMRSLTSRTGRTAAVLPLGIATDNTTKDFFGDLVSDQALVSLFGFENEEFIFPGIDHRVVFSLLTMTGADRPSPEAEFVFFARQVSSLADASRRFTLSPEDLALLNPNTRTCPIFRSARDAELTKAIYRRVPVLVNEAEGVAGNPWGVSFLAMFHMANDSGLFRTREQLEADGWVLDGNLFRRGKEEHLPLCEAKMVHHFDHRFGTFEGQIQAQANQGKLPESSEEQHQDPGFVTLPRYWVDGREVTSRLDTEAWYTGFRSVCRATDSRTVIATIVPRVAFSGKLPLLVCEHSSRHLLAANLSSFVLDYCARQKIGGTDLALFIAKQFPVLPPSEYAGAAAWDRSTSIGNWICVRLLELCSTAWDLISFARSLGWKGSPFRWDPQRRVVLRAELDSAFFQLYGLDRDETEYVLESFPVVRRNDESAFGEYRTKGLILDRYDEMAKATRTGNPYRTPLDPPPADPRVSEEMPRSGAAGA